MTSTPPDTPSGPRWKNRTSLVTAAAVAGVLIAGTAAVAANMGILDAADESAIGDLAATDELLPAAGADADTGTTTAMAVTEVTAPPTTAVPNGAQQYAIEGIGTVWITTTGSGIALDHVDAVPGWTAALTQTDPRSLQVDLTNGDRTVQFVASLGDDGLVAVDVTEPMVVMDPNSAPGANASPAVSQYDDDHEYDDHDDHEYEEHEYEGADDDD